jgi:hypothetical protein
VGESLSQYLNLVFLDGETVRNEHVTEVCLAMIDHELMAMDTLKIAPPTHRSIADPSWFPPTRFSSKPELIDLFHSSHKYYFNHPTN